MRILLVGAGASFSTKDVETGYVSALRTAGVDVKLYALDRRITMSQRWLHRLWRDRGSVPEHRPTWADVIYQASFEALEMAMRFEVDWVLSISSMFLHPDALILMRRAGVRTSVLFTESPYDDQKQAIVAQEVDACWTTERTSVPFLRQFNPNTRYLRHAYDPEQHQPCPAGSGTHPHPPDLAPPASARATAEGRLRDPAANRRPDAELTVDLRNLDSAQAQFDSTAPSHDVVFVGSGFQERIDLLSGVNWDGIDLGLYGLWDLLPSRHKLRQYVRGRMVDNATATALYRQAQIGLNLYRTSRDYSRTPQRIQHAESMNPRAYELAACGVFQLSDRRSEGMETFDWTVPTFIDAAHLNEQVRYYLQRPTLRQDKARQARQRIEPHTFAARAAQLLADLASLEQQPIAKGA